jgi:hypothetical protein
MIDSPKGYTPVCPAKKENANWLSYPSEKDNKFRKEIEEAINRNSMENRSNTPDFILAEYLQHCLAAFDLATKRRDTWYGKEQRPGQSDEHIMTFPKGADNGTLGPDD